MAEKRRYSLNDRYLRDEGTVFLTGIQALARLPLEQLRVDRRNGLNTAAFVSGYPGSPLGGYDGAIASAAKLASDLTITCRPGLNEEYGASAVMGSQLAAAQPDCLFDGILGLWYGKAPGVDRASDAFRHAVYAGTSHKGGAVAIVGDDPAAKSSTVPSSSAGVLGDMYVPLLYPGDPVEALDFGRHAIALSRATGLWTALKIVADVADATATAELHPERVMPILPEHNGQPYQHVPNGNLLTPRTLEIEREIVEVRYPLAQEYAALNGLNRVTVDPENAWIGIISSGITYREVREAFDRLGIGTDREIEACGIRLLNMGMPMPFNPEVVQNFSRGLEEVLVIEEKRQNLESLVKDALYSKNERPRIVGKLDDAGAHLVPGYGALDADLLLPVMRRRLEGRLSERLRPARGVEADPISLEVARKPFFCSGCPHNRSTEAPEGALVGAGIGCHTIALLLDSDRVGDIGGLGCMGSEGVQWIGMSDFVSREHFIQNLGDGTFFHSGQLAIQASVAAGVNVTYKILYNGAVSMTGGQLPEGQLPVRELAANLLNQGVRQVLVTTDEPRRYSANSLPVGVEVWDRTRLIEAQEHLARVQGTTVLIHDQACAAELRRARKRGRVEAPRERVVINSRICEGCGDCGQVSNCLSVQPIETPFGRKTQIDQTTCNLDYSCLEGDCPSFMSITLPEKTALPAAPPTESTSSSMSERGAHVSPDPGALPEPTWVVSDRDFTMRVTGIGGTGVVTVAQVVGTAAMLDGYQVRGLDQIGLSQKAGPVVSDLRLSRTAPTSTNRLGEGQADLLLAFDQLVAASEKGLLTADRERTTVVGSTSATPTGDMITHLEVELPSADDLIKQIADRTQSSKQFWADATEITQDLLGESTTANLFVVGMAVQAGCLPIRAVHLEEAISLNGVSVEANLAAFAWGRMQVADASRVETVRSASRAAASAGKRAASIEPVYSIERDLQNRVDGLSAGDPKLISDWTRCASELVAWGGEQRARAWLDVVERVAQAEGRVDAESTALTQEVAAQLFKLLAYKDEYEVARLMTDDAAMFEAREVAGELGSIRWKLHPPLLRAMGLKRKISIGAWAVPLVRLLARGRVLRGTPFDVFGYAELRRIERALPEEYVAVLDRALLRLSASNLGSVIRLARLPDQVRGYEEIKLRRIAAFREALIAAEASL